MGHTGQWGWGGLQGEETGVCQGEEKEEYEEKGSLRCSVRGGVTRQMTGKIGPEHKSCYCLLFFALLS